MTEPIIIQGGMGAAISDWRLANAVARRGQLGVVSGTALDQILSRRLQMGDPGGHLRRAMAHFPDQDVVARVVKRYFVEGGKTEEEPFLTSAMYRIDASVDLLALTVLANFVEIWLAREGHDGIVGINLLEKIQLPNLPSLYGAMLAGVDYVLMGAGIPWQIPGILDSLAHHGDVRMRIAVDDEKSDTITEMEFSPAKVLPGVHAPLKRPRFLAIVSSAVLSQALIKRATGKIDGFIVERPTAGGHNAPPRGALKLSPSGEPIYGERDEVDFSKMRALGLPFWIAGSAGNPAQLAEARSLGASGIQVGTAFAFCQESGLEPSLKQEILERVRRGEQQVFTDPLASPTGFPFKVALLPGTLSETAIYEERGRICDAGYLRTVYRKPDGEIGYRCPAEPTDPFLKKGGAIEETHHRKCLCNALLANIGLSQIRSDGSIEQPLVTAGDDLVNLGPLLPPDGTNYTAEDVLAYLLSEVPSRV